MTLLSGKRILVVEDEFLIGAMLTDILVGAGSTVVGPARTAAEGVALAASEALDGAVVDVNLRGENSERVWAELMRRNVPFILATGYGDSLHSGCTAAMIVAKPFTEERLLRVLARAIQHSKT